MVDPLLVEHLGYLELERLAKSTLDRHRRVLGAYQEFLTHERQLTLDRALPRDVLAFVEHRTKAGVKDHTVRQELCVLTRLYDRLYRLGRIDRDPTSSLPTLICKPIKEKGYLTVDECFRLLQPIDTTRRIGRRDAAIVALLWSTGLRTSELCALRWRHLDLLHEGTLLVQRGKGGKQRRLFLNDRIKSDLIALRDELAPLPADPVFYAMGNHRNPEKRPISTRRLAELFEKLTAAARIDKVATPLTMRHTFATHMFEAGATVSEIKELLGHDHETESSIYIHVTLGAARSLLEDHVANPSNYPEHTRRTDV